MRDFNPEHLETEKIQLWTPDTMLTLIPLSEARDLVKEKKYFVITCQAIGFNREDLK